MENQLLGNDNPRPERRPSRSNQTKNFKVAIGILSFLLLGGLAGTCLFGIFAWNYSNELDIADAELTRTKAIIKDVVCDNIIENDLGIRKPTNVLKAADGGFVVSNDKSLVKATPFGNIAWNYSTDATLTPVVANGLDGNFLTVESTEEAERLVKLNNKGTLLWKADLPQGRNMSKEILVDRAGGNLIHGVSYHNETNSYSSYFLKYDLLGSLSWSVDTPGFIANSVTHHSAKYYLVGELYSQDIRCLGIYTLDEDGKLELLAKNLNALTIHGAFWNDTTLLTWFNDIAGVEIYAYDSNGAAVLSKHLPEISRIHQCVSGENGNVVCTCEEGEGGALQALGPNFEWVWGNRVPGMVPKVLEVTVEGSYLAVFSEPNRNYNQRHQKYLEVNKEGKLLMLKEYKTKTAEIISAVPYGKNDIYAILGGPVFYGEQVDAETKAVIFPRKLDLSDMNYYC